MDFSKYSHCVSTLPLFQNLTVEQIRAVQTEIRETTFLPGEMIYQAGEQADALYLIQAGQVRIYRLSSTGKEQQIRILEPGDIMGEASLFNDQVFDHYIQAVDTTIVCSLSRLDFHTILVSHPEISLELLSVLSERLNESEQQVTLITTESVMYRLVHFILSECDKQGTTKVRLKMTKKNIASYLGMSAESFSRALTKLTKHLCIKQPSPDIIEVLDRDKLTAQITE